MKHYKYCKVRLLNAEQKTKLFSFDKAWKILEWNENDPEHFVTKLGAKYKHIYIISEEKILDGDLCCWLEDTEKKSKPIFRAKSHIAFCDADYINTPQFKGKIGKIIASTAESLKLPKICSKDIQKYIKSFNIDNSLEEIPVYYEENRHFGSFDVSSWITLDPVLTEDNCIITKTIKHSFTREEVVKIAKNILLATGREIKTTMHFKESYVEFDLKDANNWISNNI